MPNTIFRICRASDLPAIKSFADRMFAEDADAHGGTPNLDLTFQELTARPDKGRLLVFEQDGKPIGYAIIIFFWSNEYHGDVIDIDEIFVAEEFRGSGVGAEFFKWLEKEFAQECVGLSLQVSSTNRAAKLYERLGFESSRNRHMFKLLRSPVPAGSIP